MTDRLEVIRSTRLRSLWTQNADRSEVADYDWLLSVVEAADELARAAGVSLRKHNYSSGLTNALAAYQEQRTGADE